MVGERERGRWEREREVRERQRWERERGVECQMKHEHIFSHALKHSPPVLLFLLLSSSSSSARVRGLVLV